MKYIKIITSFILFSYPLITMANSASIERLTGQFNEKKESEFVSLDKTVLPVNKKGMYLQKEATEQLIKAYHDFKKSHPDVPFVIVSATRNYTYQNGIWQRKWNSLFPQLKNEQKTAKEILKYSSMPGTSRHHWGTDVDITSVSSDYFQHNAKGKILYQWLEKNMPTYGFCQPYNTGRKGGYLPEEWHWSYQPIAQNYLLQYKKLIEEKNQTLFSRLNFSGSSKISLQALVLEYVTDVDQTCY